MMIRSVKNRWFTSVPAGVACGGAALLLGFVWLASPAASAEKQAGKTGEAWPATVQARYRLSYNGINVGRLHIHTSITARTYSVSGSGKVSVLLGTYSWKVAGSVTGTIEDGAPAPANYDLEWHQKKKKKDVAVHMGYKDRVAADVNVTPPPRQHGDIVPLKPAHKAGAVDPLSAILQLTKADGRSPCDRRANIFDGMQRYDVVFSPKRQVRMASLSGGDGADIAHVCRMTYEPVAGHRDNADTKAYAAIRDVEVLMRRIPGTGMVMPYSVTIPTPWGSSTMTADRIEIVTSNGKIAWKD